MRVRLKVWEQKSPVKPSGRALLLFRLGASHRLSWRAWVTACKVSIPLFGDARHLKPVVSFDPLC
jgi:hypothetical protein